jgi:hypothetical protein
VALLAVLVVGGGAAGGLALLNSRQAARPVAAVTPRAVAVLKPFTWQQWTPIKAVLDADGPRKDGRMVIAANGGLQLISTRGELTPFAPTYKVDAGSESYLTVSPGLSVAGAGCSFGQSEVFGLRLAAPVGVNRVDGSGTVTNLAVLTGFDGLNAIGFDTVGSFDHRLLVAGPSHANQGHERVMTVDCKGASTVVTDNAPVFEGGVSVAPRSFGKFGGTLIVPDELSGRILAIRADGTSELVADSGLAAGGDIGVESAGFVPAGFIAAGGAAYMADRVSAGNPHPGTDTLLRAGAAQLRLAGVTDGDLLVATEGGGLTIFVHCVPGGRCLVRSAGQATPGAHVEGHIAFDFR